MYRFAVSKAPRNEQLLEHESLEIKRKMKKNVHEILEFEMNKTTPTHSSLDFSIFLSTFRHFFSRLYSGPLERNHGKTFHKTFSQNLFTTFSPDHKWHAEMYQIPSRAAGCSLANSLDPAANAPC